MVRSEIVVSVRVENCRALRALNFAATQIADAYEDQPWRPELKRAVRALRYAARHLKPEVKK